MRLKTSPSLVKPMAASFYVQFRRAFAVARPAVVSPMIAPMNVVARPTQVSTGVFDLGDVPPKPPAKVTVPAEADASTFKLHTSVEYWRNQPTFNTVLSRLAGQPVDIDRDGLPVVLRAMSQSVLVSNREAAAYWAYHTARFSYFLAQAFGTLLADQVRNGTAKQAADGNAGGETMLQRLLANNGRQASQELIGRFTEAAAMFLQDWENIRTGVYRLPWDMTTLSHRQYNPLFVLQRSALMLYEGAETLRKRKQRSKEGVWFQSDLYPDYYMLPFHHQPDGWMSSRSARIYEHSTETLFQGRQDAMQRTALLAVQEFVAGREPSQLKLLEVACGTGRFHTFLKDNYPMMASTALDLSPFYLQEARKNLKYWKALRQPRVNLGGVDGTGTDFLQGLAERIPAPDASYDIVLCNYLFHELPLEARQAAAKEMFRVLRPGGMVVLTDSVQLGDRPEWDNRIGFFGNFNEPHYQDFITCDLGEMFQQAGFACGTKYMASASKTLSFMKPAPEPVVNPADADLAVAVAEAAAATEN